MLEHVNFPVLWEFKETCNVINWTCKNLFSTHGYSSRKTDKHITFGHTSADRNSSSLYTWKAVVHFQATPITWMIHAANKMIQKISYLHDLRSSFRPSRHVPLRMCQVPNQKRSLDSFSIIIRGKTKSKERKFFTKIYRYLWSIQKAYMSWYVCRHTCVSEY